MGGSLGATPIPVSDFSLPPGKSEPAPMTHVDTQIIDGSFGFEDGRLYAEPAHRKLFVVDPAGESNCAELVVKA